MPARLILNADDFGQAAGINRAIAELFEAGVLSSATLMAGGEAFDGAVDIAQQNPGLGVGCHLVFVDGKPILPAELVPSLVGRDGKSFRSSIFDFARAALTGALQAEHVEREARAQIERLQRAGVRLTHVDSHKHTHLFPAVLGPVLAAARACGVPSVRRPFEPWWSSQLAGAPPARRMQLAILGRFRGSFDRMTADVRKEDQIPDATLGIAATGTLDAGRLRSLLLAMPKQGTFDLCCHPGHLDSDLAGQTTRLRESREIEYRALLEVIPEILRTAQAPQLIHYGDLGRTRGIS